MQHLDQVILSVTPMRKALKSKPKFCKLQEQCGYTCICDRDSYNGKLYVIGLQE